MPISRLQHDIRIAKDALDALGELKLSPALRRQLAEARRCLGDALDCVIELRDDVFALQEQNQQLRRDLSEKICPRICALPHRSAT